MQAARPADLLAFARREVAVVEPALDLQQLQHVLLLAWARPRSLAPSNLPRGDHQQSLVVTSDHQ